MGGKKRGILLRLDEETINLLTQQAERNYRSRAQECYKILFEAARSGSGSGTKTPTVNSVETTEEPEIKEPDTSYEDEKHEKGLALLEELESNADPLED